MVTTVSTSESSAALSGLTGFVRIVTQGSTLRIYTLRWCLAPFQGYAMSLKSQIQNVVGCINIGEDFRADLAGPIHIHAM